MRGALSAARGLSNEIRSVIILSKLASRNDSTARERIIAPFCVHDAICNKLTLSLLRRRSFQRVARARYASLNALQSYSRRGEVEVEPTGSKSLDIDARRPRSDARMESERLRGDAASSRYHFRIERTFRARLIAIARLLAVTFIIPPRRDDASWSLTAQQLTATLRTRRLEFTRHFVIPALHPDDPRNATTHRSTLSDDRRRGYSRPARCSRMRSRELIRRWNDSRATSIDRASS